MGTYYIRVKQPKDSHIIYKDVMRTSVEVEVTGVAAFEARYAEREVARGTEGQQVLAQTTAGTFSFNGTSVEAQDVETPRHRFSRSPLAQTWKDAAGGDVESSRQLASATLASSIPSSALAVPPKTVPCSTLLLTSARIQNPSVIQSLLQRSSGLLDSSTG